MGGFFFSLKRLTSYLAYIGKKEQNILLSLNWLNDKENLLVLWSLKEIGDVNCVTWIIW